jgi:hypothetical protein
MGMDVIRRGCSFFGKGIVHGLDASKQGGDIKSTVEHQARKKPDRLIGLANGVDHIDCSKNSVKWVSRCCKLIWAI